MDDLDWGNEPDLDQLRELHARFIKNPEDVLPSLEALGERGSVASAMYLADFYVKTAKDSSYADRDKAKYWYLKAHERGYPPASYMLGRLCVQANEYDDAFSAFFKGSEHNYAPAIYRLAKLYQIGKGAPKNIDEYKRLLEIAHLKGHVFAKRDLAALLISGKFGMIPALRGLFILLSLWQDVFLLIKKALSPGSTFDERILA